MDKRIILLCGHYGSGKTNIAVNLAFKEREIYDRVAIADLDIVNPYFRSKDSEEDFKQKDIRLICSKYASSNVDIPSLPDDLYSIIDDKSQKVIIDVGGDDRGALALGRLTPGILQENNFENLLVINKYRPLTRDLQSTIEVMREIEWASHLPFTGIVNNSNLGEDTTAEDVLDSIEYANSISKETNLKVVFTSVSEKVYKQLEGKMNNLFPMKLQKKII